MKIDAAAKRLLWALATSPAATTAELAAAAEVSEAVARDRLAAMEAAGVYRPTIWIDPDLVGLPHAAVVLGNPTGATTSAALKRLQNAPGVTRVMTVTGRHGILFTVRGGSDVPAQALRLANEAGLAEIDVEEVVRLLSDDPALGTAAMLIDPESCLASGPDSLGGDGKVL